jgi:hypothetical protein
MTTESIPFLPTDELLISQGRRLTYLTNTSSFPQKSAYARKGDWKITLHRTSPLDDRWRLSNSNIIIHISEHGIDCVTVLSVFEDHKIFPIICPSEALLQTLQALTELELLNITQFSDNFTEPNYGN